VVNAIEGLTPSIAFGTGDGPEGLHPYPRSYRLLRNPVLRVSLTVVVSAVRDEFTAVDFIYLRALAVLSAHVSCTKGGNRTRVYIDFPGSVDLVLLVNVDPVQGPEFADVYDGLRAPTLVW